MDRLHLMTVFVAVVENEGFASAARKLRLSPPAVSRAVSELETRLGVKLLHRTTRHLQITDAGQRYYKDAKQIVALSEEADDAVRGRNAIPKGLVKITASVLFGRLYVMDGLISYLKNYPDMQVDALFVDRVVNMLEEGVDVAIRIGELQDSSYKAIKVGAIRRVLCASTSYLKEYGYPKKPEDLSNHKIILARGLSPSNELKFMDKGKASSVRVDPFLAVSDNFSAEKAVLADMGISRFLSYQVAESLESGALKIILSEYEHPPVPVHVVHREGRYSSARTRSLIDWMVEHLRSQTSLN
ncbi:MAG TPA: LysR family transcriptional regulator [Methylophaga aminisulfidivorans]|jgi:DNA-binding transcriptional LysR family regulator|uniref:LysR family transcriptional regulator n=1 Tax=Methylophaga TaxID=40222 RepID=UPI001777FA24|nr:MULTISPECIES: LysR family transcriptional regulator [Methylophaga]HIC47025.1 LysR family transcriptional regulator [Methylophaga sp.]HIM39585.1 LysR family transcriptional regulator [Methylophaga aminisulfidivorans]